MAVIKREGKPVTDAHGRVKKNAKGEPVLTPHRHLKSVIPGWGVFRKSADTTSLDLARDYDRVVQRLGQLGATDILDALRDDRLTLAKALSLWADGAGIAGLRKHIAEMGRPAVAGVLIAPLIPGFLKDGSPRKAARREDTNRNYQTHLVELVRALGGETSANLGLLTTPTALKAHIANVYHVRLADNVSLRRCQPQRPTLSQRRWKLLRDASRVECEAMPHEELVGESTHEERAAAGATANRHKATAKAFISWLLRTDPVFVEAAKGQNVASELRDYDERTLGEDHMTRAEWALFRAEALEYDAEMERGVMTDDGESEELTVAAEEQWPCTLLWDMLLATGTRTFTEGVDRLSMASFQAASRTNGLVAIQVVGTKTDASATRLLWVDASLYDRCKAHAERWGVQHGQPLFSRVTEAARVPLDRSRVGRVFRRLCTRVAERHGMPDFERFSPYSLRHTFAVWQIQGDPDRGVPGVDIAKLAYMMGHGTNIETTMRYAKYRAVEQQHGARIMAAGMGAQAPQESTDPLAAAAAALGLTPEQLRAAATLIKTLGPQ